MKAIRLWLSYVFEPVVRVALHILQRLMGHSRLRIGKLTFWGEPGFLASCEMAVGRLQDLDSELHVTLTQRLNLTFYHNAKRLEQVSSLGLFSIDDRYFAWQADGIIARLVNAARLVACEQPRIVTKKELPTVKALRAAASGATGDWLAARRFPEALVTCFKEHKHI
jgi:hypothetical protein